MLRLQACWPGKTSRWTVRPTQQHQPRVAPSRQSTCASWKLSMSLDSEILSGYKMLQFRMRCVFKSGRLPSHAHDKSEHELERITSFPAGPLSWWLPATGLDCWTVIGAGHHRRKNNHNTRTAPFSPRDVSHFELPRASLRIDSRIVSIAQRTVWIEGQIRQGGQWCRTFAEIF